MVADDRELREILRTFEGLQAGRGGSTVRAVGTALEVRCVFDDSWHGHAALQLLRQITDYLKIPCTDERVAGDRVAARHYRLEGKSIAAFLGRMRYASIAPLRDLPKPRKIRGTPVATQLPRALGTFEADYEQHRKGDAHAPSLAVWANCLRPFADDGMDQVEFGAASILATRAERVVIRDLGAQGWLDVLASRGRGRGKFVRLSQRGRAARDAGAALLQDATATWTARFDAADVQELTDVLVRVLEAVAVELPHHFTGYGPGDTGVTGGSYVAAKPGPPAIPAHGAEWPVVLRKRGEVARLPVSALLSQALTAFSIDYGSAHFGALGETMRFLQHVPDTGMDLPTARRLGHVNGTSRSTHERHLVAVAEPGTTRTPNQPQSVSNAQRAEVPGRLPGRAA